MTLQNDKKKYSLDNLLEEICSSPQEPITQSNKRHSIEIEESENYVPDIKRHCCDIEFAELEHNFTILNPTLTVENNFENLNDFEYEETCHSKQFNNNFQKTKHYTDISIGRRIVDVNELFTQLKKIEKHGVDCCFNDLNIVHEVKRGLNSFLKIKCSKCSKVFYTHTCESYEETKQYNKMNVNYSAVLGTLVTGAGHSQLEELLGTLDIPCMSPGTFASIEKEIGNNAKEISNKLMQQAVAEEIEEAKTRGHIDKDGIPLLTAVIDGYWSHRSYKHSFKSIAGAATIIGFYTKKSFMDRI